MDAQKTNSSAGDDSGVHPLLTVLSLRLELPEFEGDYGRAEVAVDYFTINRWVLKYAPELE